MTQPMEWSMYPTLHDHVSQQLEASGLSVNFIEECEADDPIEEHETFIMGAFTCPNDSCSNRWTSKKIGITIQFFTGHLYNAKVWHQRCQECDTIGSPRLNEGSYVNRVVYRLGKWLGLRTSAPPFTQHGQGPPHVKELCEGCKNGHCMEAT